MAVAITTLQFTASTGGGTQNIAHGHGTTPEAAIFFLTNATTLETAATGAHMGIGFSDGTTNRCMAWRSLDGDTSSTTRMIGRNSAVTIFNVSGGGTDGEATATFGATNLTLTWSDTPSSAFYIEAVLFSGLDGTAVVEQALNGTTAAPVTHNLGLTTSNEALIFGLTSGRNAGTWVKEIADALFSFGVAHWNGSVFAQRGYAFSEDNSESSGRPAAYLDTDDFFQVITSTYSLEYDAGLSDFQTNDFDITASAAAGTDDCAFLVLGLPSGTAAWVGDISAPTTLGSQAYTPLSWLPQYVGLFTTQIETRDSLRQNTDGDEAGAYGISGIDDSQGICCAVAIENDSATPDTQSTAAAEAVYMPADDGTLAASASAGNGCHASFTSLDSTGWTIDTTGLSANSTQTYWIAWAIQGEGGAGPEQAAFSAGASVTDGEISTASALGQFVEAMLSSDALSASASASAGMEESFQAAQVEGGTASAIGSFVGSSDAADLLEAIAAASAAIQQGALAGEAWVGDTLAENLGEFSESTQASDAFLAAAQTIADITGNANAGDIVLSMAQAFANIAEGATAADAFTSIVAGLLGEWSDGTVFSESTIATAQAFGEFSEAGTFSEAFEATEVAAPLGEILLAISADALFSAVGQVSAGFSAAVTAGAVFIALEPSVVVGHLVIGSIAVQATLRGIASNDPAVKGTPSVN